MWGCVIQWGEFGGAKLSTGVLRRILHSFPQPQLNSAPHTPSVASWASTVQTPFQWSVSLRAASTLTWDRCHWWVGSVSHREPGPCRLLHPNQAEGTPERHACPSSPGRGTRSRRGTSFCSPVTVLRMVAPRQAEAGPWTEVSGYQFWADGRHLCELGLSISAGTWISGHGHSPEMWLEFSPQFVKFANALWDPSGGKLHKGNVQITRE